MEGNRGYSFTVPDKALCCEERARRIDEVIDESQNERKRTKPGQKVDRFDAGWYVFDDLSSDQAEGLLTYHGGPASYLVINSNSYPEWLFYVKLKDDEGIMFHSHTVTKMNGGYIMQGKTVVHNSLDDVEQAFLATYKARGTVLSPLFHDDRPEIADKDGDPERIKNLTISQCFDLPPEYQSANRYPKAPSKALPSVKPFKAIMPSPLPQSPNPPPNPPPPEPKSSCCCTVL